MHKTLLTYIQTLKFFINIHTYIQIQTNTYIHTYLLKYIHKYIVYMHTYIHDIHTYITYINTLHTYIQTHTHCTYIHVYQHIHQILKHVCIAMKNIHTKWKYIGKLGDMLRLLFGRVYTIVEEQSLVGLQNLAMDLLIVLLLCKCMYE